MKDDLPTLTALTELLDQFEQAGLRYCSWKGNYRLCYILAGLDDLDLHVHARDFAAMQAILIKAQFKLADTPSNRLQPGVFHFIGNDTATGKLLNVHVYRRILTGDHMLKTWALPLSAPLLQDTEQQHGLRTINRSCELAIHLVRSMLKYTTVYDCYRAISQADERRMELAWILEQADPDTAYAMLQAHLPAISRSQFDTSLALLQNDQSSLFARIKAGISWGWRLRKYRRFGWFKQASLTGWCMAVMLRNRIIYKQKHMRLLSGGAVIALVGPQATGKSTLANAVQAWLGEELSIQLIHAGKPPRRVLTWLPSKAIPLAKKLIPEHTSVAIETRDRTDRPPRYPLSFVLRKVMLAYDRVGLLRKVFRRSASRAIVLTDRYPSDAVGAIDGPTFSQASINAETSKLKRALMVLERNLYALINSPDLVIQLEVPVEEAVKRNVTRDKADKQTNGYVVARHGQTIKPEFLHCPTEVLSTQKPLQESILEIKRLIWAQL